MSGRATTDNATYAYTVHPRVQGRTPLSDAEIERVRLDQPDDPIKLPKGWLACRTCGVAVQQTADLGEEIHLTSRGRAVEGAAAMTDAVQNQQPIPLVFGLCADHRRTQELATQLIDVSNHPAYRDLMACALDALSFIAPQTVEHMAFLDHEGLNALSTKLGHLGAQARWVSRFVPVTAPEADSRTCTPRAWAHLMPGKRTDLRQAYAALLKERAARNAAPVPIPPPPVGYLTGEIPIEGGCLFCGVGHQMVPAVTASREGPQNLARSLWTPKRTGTQQLGGRASPDWLSGHLCQVCAEALEHVHAMGPSALERALVAALAPQGIGKLGWGQLDVKGLIGWGALVARARQADPPEPDPRPNTKPWEHLGDLDELRQRLGAALHV